MRRGVSISVRSSGSPHVLSLEQALETIAPDELVEATPTSVRLRKTELDQTVRGRTSKRARVAASI